MTAVDVTTGEVLVACTPDEARELTERIRSTLEFTWDRVVEAYQRRAWDALGYNSWNHYCTQEFGASSLKLPREDRRETIASLRDAGLSTRAIAAATGVSKSQVDRDLSGAPNGTPEVEPRFKKSQVTGTDGKTYPAKTTVTERITETRQTVTEPPAGADGPSGGEGLSRRRQVEPEPSDGPEDAEPVDVERHADPRLTFRANFSRDIAKAGVLRMVDVDKAVACADPDDLAGFRQSIESIRDWCERFLTASSTSHLRRVK